MTNKQLIITALRAYSKQLDDATSMLLFNEMTESQHWQRVDALQARELAHEIDTSITTTSCL